MKRKSLTSAMIAVLAAIATAQAGEQIEPNAESWKTWVIPSGRDFRTPPPGDAAASGEIEELKALATQRDARNNGIIAYWAPAGVQVSAGFVRFMFVSALIWP